MKKHGKPNYVEFPSKNLPATKDFFGAVFGWKFKDFSEKYTAFSSEGLDGGFFKSEMSSATANGGALLVFHSEDLEKTMAKIRRHGGTVVKPVFSFPGGRRFHFTEPGGNELAVWSDVGARGESLS